ncbi:MAG: flagellar hook-basal body complex protein FliE [Thermoanaerobacteraceae bacterium]|nr:flagellar hook-basal body complex protein FliE [Thermoanaerobacteraceae bacterium]
MKIELDSNTINSNFGGSKAQREKSFSQIFKAALESVNTYQKDYESVLYRQLFSEDVDLHDVVIAGEKARLSLELALQIRNKAMEAYQEIMRMQI